MERRLGSSLEEEVVLHHSTDQIRNPFLSLFFMHELQIDMMRRFVIGVADLAQLDPNEVKLSPGARRFGLRIGVDPTKLHFSNGR